MLEVFLTLLDFAQEWSLVIIIVVSSLIGLTILWFGGKFAFAKWVERNQGKYAATLEWTLLAIDIPKMHEQSMKAVEHIMVALHGVYSSPSRREKYIDGFLQPSFSLEVVSIDGYVQYFIRSPRGVVDLVKGAIFAQYPEAEITEVEDYTKQVPLEFPDYKIDMFGTEFMLSNSDVYPIKTYEHFEHQLTGTFADPMSSILQLLSRLKPGEQVWLQWVVTPEGPEWREKGLQEVNGLIGRNSGSGGGGLFSSVVGEFRSAIFGGGAPVADVDDGIGKFQELTTGEKIVVEEIQKKLSRLHFHTKFRFLYFAQMQEMDTARVAGSVVGAIKQFNSLDMNAFAPGAQTTTSVSAIFGKRRKEVKRKNELLVAYRDRSNSEGEDGFVMSHVELATLFHFPSTSENTTLARSESRKSEAPVRLPVADSPFTRLKKQAEEQLAAEEDTPPQELPVAEPTPVQPAPPPQPTYQAPPAPPQQPGISQPPAQPTPQPLQQSTSSESSDRSAPPNLPV